MQKVSIRVFAKIFVLVISRNSHEIFNFVFREISLEFREILRNTYRYLGDISQFREKQIQNLGNFFAKFAKSDDFFNWRI